MYCSSGANVLSCLWCFSINILLLWSKLDLLEIILLIYRSSRANDLSCVWFFLMIYRSFGAKRILATSGQYINRKKSQWKAKRSIGAWQSCYGLGNDVRVIYLTSMAKCILAPSGQYINRKKRPCKAKRSSGAWRSCFCLGNDERIIHRFSGAMVILAP